MLFMKCPVCNDEYTVTPVRNKTGSFVCQACGWHGDGFSPWGTLFDKERWLESRQGVANALRGRIFMGAGFPVDLLAGRIAYRDGVLLVKAETCNGPLVVEYPVCKDGSPAPEWLKKASSGTPLTALKRFRAWLHDEGRDAVYVCDSFRKAILIMEAWWNAEGRLPDIVWGGSHGPAPATTPGWLAGRHLLFIGAGSLIKTTRPKDCKSSTWLVTEGADLPEDLYLACRKLEDMANDPGNYGNTVELRMDDFKRGGRCGGLGALGLPGGTFWKKLLEVQKKCLPAGGVPQAISHVPSLRPGEKKWNARTRKRRVQVKDNTKRPNDNGR